jgi:hypothetical protein
MILPNEWQQKAEKYSWAINDQESYLDGATAYKQAVEKAVNERIGHLEESIKRVQDMHLNGLITAAKTELLILLDTLQTLKPTSND